MTTSRVPGTINAIVAAFTGAGLKTWDGPNVTGDFEDSVFVGYDADPDSDFQAVANHQQEWAGLGKNSRRESFSVVCAVLVTVGDDEVPEGRAKAYALLETVGQVLRDDPSLGQPSPFVCSLRPNQLFTEPTSPSGMQVRIPFFVDIQISRV